MMMDRAKLAAFQPVYHRIEREWYLWNGTEALEENGELRLFVSASDAYEWIAEQVGRLPAEGKD